MKNMKRILMLMLSIVIIFAFTACGGGEEPAAGGEDPGTSKAGATSYMEMLQSGTYYMEYTATMEVDGKSQTVEAKVAMDGNKMSSESTMNGQTSRLLSDGENTYLIDDKAKTYMQMDMSMNKDEILEAGDDMVIKNSGKEEVDGQELDYEEYADEETSVKFYFDGDGVKYILSSGEGDEVLMKIVEFTDKIPSGLLELPSDYVSGIPGM